MVHSNSTGGCCRGRTLIWLDLTSAACSSRLIQVRIGNENRDFRFSVVARMIMAANAFKPCMPEEVLPGAHLDNDEELTLAAGNIATTIFHPVGTARMGKDRNSVVDERLRVHGIDGLRIVDASVMPTITSGNTNAPTLMIAEKGASMILEDRHSALSG